MAVKKSGPTTGLTNGNITAVSATINVSYGSGKTARFTNQIVVGSGDFIAAGDSGSLMVDGAVSTLKNFLQAVHHKFQLPIWLTEYSLIRWTKPPTYPSWEQQAKFASKSIEMLETLPFVERYAWFSLPPWMKDGSDRISLYYQNGDLTPAGVAFQKGPAMPPPNADAVGSEVDMGPGLVGDGFAAGSH
jgi:hypothetical protein